MALLDMIGNACEQIGLVRPSSVISSLDQQIKQLLALANREGRELATGDSVGLSYYWTALDTEATWVTTATEDQGAITTLLPGYRRLIGETMWNRSLRQRVPVVTPQDWQQIKAGNINTAYPYFRFRGTRLLFTPTPTVGQTIATEYASFKWTQNAAGNATATAWQMDDDTGVLPEDIMQQGIVWRFKAAKNFDYAEDYRTYQNIVQNAMANDGLKPRLNASTALDWIPQIAIPNGSWAIL